MSRDFSHLDLLDPQTHSGDPWPLYEWLREEHPVYWDPQTQMWWVSGFDEIVEVAKDPETYTSTEGNVPKTPSDPSFINLDGDAHRNRRNLVSGYFSKTAVAKMRQHIEDAVDGLIDEVIERGRCDFVEDIASPLPMRIIGEMLGIPEEMHDEVCRWMDVFITGGNGPDHVTMDVNEAFVNFGGLHMELVDQRRQEPKDDLLSLWVHTEIEGERLDEDQLLFEHTMFLVGGSETARNAISGGVEQMALHPEQRARLLDDRALIGNAMEESIRWVTPFIRMSRTLTRDVTFRGFDMREGQEIAMLYPPANRDPKRFPDPYTFDVARDLRGGTLAFGYGRHFCIGAFLARAEGEAAFRRLLARAPDWRLAGEPVMQVSSFLRGLKSLPIEFTPGKRLGR